MQWLITLSFFVVSTTSLLPYNLFMNAHEYFYYKLHNTSSYNETDFKPIHGETILQRQFEGYLTLFGGIACIFGAAFNLFLTTKLSNNFRVHLGHIIVIISLIPTIIYTYIDTDDSQEEFFYLSLVLASLASFGSLGLIGGGIMGLVSAFPPGNLKAVLMGQSAGGIFAAVLSIICQLATSDLVWNGRAYFLIATTWTILSIGFYNFVNFKAKSLNLTDSQSDTDSLLHNEVDGESEEFNGSSTSEKEVYKRAFSQSKNPLICVMLTLIVSLSAFPAIASLVKSVSHNMVWIGYFSSICCFLAFNIGDACGRCLGSMTKLTTKWLTIFCFMRIIFIPLIIICNIEPRYHTPTLLPYDGVFLLIIIFFGISHGLTFSVAVDQVSSSVDADCGEVSGSIINLACVLSAFVGSFIGVGLVSLV